MNSFRDFSNDDIEYVRTVKWEASGDWIATASWDHTAKLIDFVPVMYYIQGTQVTKVTKFGSEIVNFIHR